MLDALVADLKTQQALLKAAEADLQANVAKAQADLAQQANAMSLQSKDMEHAGQQMTAQAERSGEDAAAAIVQAALQAVDGRMGKIEEMLSRPAPQPIIVTGGGQRNVQLVRDANGNLAGASIQDS